jgi:hypothetical protein
LRLSAGLGRTSSERFRSSPRGRSAIGSGRQDGQGDARAAHRLAILESRTGERDQAVEVLDTVSNGEVVSHRFEIQV